MLSEWPISTHEPAEILEELPKLTPQERQQLAQGLETLQRWDDPAFLAEMTDRLDEVKAGKYVTKEQVRAILAKRGIEVP